MFNQTHTRQLYVHMYAKLQNFVQLSHIYEQT